jgi:predicted lysophospholipase L1 biosynthesis ABC-type transport system permease subunit
LIQGATGVVAAVAGLAAVAGAVAAVLLFAAGAVAVLVALGAAAGVLAGLAEVEFAVVWPLAAATATRNKEQTIGFIVGSNSNWIL